MHRRTLCPLALFASALLHGALGPCQTLVEVSLDEALAAAQSNAPEVLAADARTHVADAEIGVAGLMPNPRLRAVAMSEPLRLQINATVPLPIFGQLGALADAARANADTARQTATAARLDARLGAANAWLTLWLSEQQSLAADETSARRRRLVEAIRERFTAGAAPELDVLRAQVEVARADAEREALTHAVRAAAARLGPWIGRAQDAVNLRANALPEAGALPALQALEARVDRHPRVLEAEGRARAAERTARAESRLRWPVPSLELGFNALPLTAGHASDVYVGLSTEVPLFHLRGPMIQRAEATVTAARFERDAVRARLRADLAAAYENTLSAMVRARGLQEVVALAREAQARTTEGYAAGRGDIQSVLAAEQTLTDAALAVAVARANAALARVELSRALGGDP